jgi:hypothetical protein
MKKIIVLLISNLICFCLYAQQTDWKKVGDDLKITFRNPEFVTKILDRKKLTGIPRRVVQEHFIEIYKNDEVIDYLVNEMRLAGFDKNNSKNALEDSKRFGSELFLSLAIKGINRLPISDQRRYISYSYQFMSFVTPVECKNLLISNSSLTALDNAEIELKYYSKFKEADLRNYYITLRQAMLAEIRDFPSSKGLNSNQIKIADDTLQVELAKKMEKQNFSNNVLQAFSDLNSAAPIDACDAGKFIMKTVLDTKGYAGDLIITKLILSMQ